MSSLPTTKVAQSLAATLNIDAEELQRIIVNTVMPAGATNEEVAAFMIVCNTYKLNPLLKQIAAFPTKQQGIMPMVMIDGWLQIMHSHPKFNGMDQFDYFDGDKNGWYVTTSIYVKGIEHAITVTEYFDECYIAPKEKDGKTPEGQPWDKWPKRMLRHKSLIQCIRYALGIGGIYDYDELIRMDNAIDAEVLPVNSYINGPMKQITPYSAIEAAVKEMGLTLELKKEYGKDWAYARGDSFSKQSDLKKLGFIVRKNAQRKWDTKKDVTLNLLQVETADDQSKVETVNGQSENTLFLPRTFVSLQELSQAIEERNHQMILKPSGEKMLAKIDIDAEDEDQVKFAHELGFVQKKGHFIKDVTKLPEVAA